MSRLMASDYLFKKSVKSVKITRIFSDKGDLSDWWDRGAFYGDDQTVILFASPRTENKVIQFNLFKMRHSIGAERWI